ncbi:hypothetical protein R1flu_015821 [Riccia fluitans]|uniref:Uncharacterized protein n=1 Tax=Riccia fluitans TaxID=41844 RepID=A0ABD1YKX1_9MARC
MGGIWAFQSAARLIRLFLEGGYCIVIPWITHSPSYLPQGRVMRYRDTNLEGLSFVPCIELLSDTVMRLGGSSALDRALRRAVRMEPRFRYLGIGRGIGGSYDEAEFLLARSYGSRDGFGLPELR